jgi:hypothetical protein
MKRQLQIQHGVALGEWQGGGGMPIPPDASWTFVDVTNRPDAHVGYSYDAATDTFTPPPPPPPDYGQTVSARDFLLRFTAQERKAIRQAAKTDEDVADWYAVAQVPEPIRLHHPTTLAGLDFLVAKNLLTPQRKDAIAG